MCHRDSDFEMCFSWAGVYVSQCFFPKAGMHRNASFSYYLYTTRNVNKSGDGLQDIIKLHQQTVVLMLLLLGVKVCGLKQNLNYNQYINFKSD